MLRSYANSIMFKIILISIPVGLAMLCIIRVFFGIEISDEIFYISEGYLVAKGGIPFVDNYFPSGFQLITGSFVGIYDYIVGSTEGILIYMRIVYLAIIFGILLATYLLLKKHIEKIPLLFFLIVLIPFAPFSIWGLNYNSMSCICLFFTCILIIKATFVNEKDSFKYISLSACSISLAIISYPTSIIIGILIAIILFFLKMKKQAIVYCVTGAIMGVTTLVLLIIKCGGITNFIIGFFNIVEYVGGLDQVKKETTEISKEIVGLFLETSWIYVMLVIAIFVILIISAAMNLKAKQSLNLKSNTKESLLKALIASMIIYLGYVFFKLLFTDVYISSYISIPFAAIPVFLYFVFLREKSSVCKKMLFICVVFYVHYLVVAISSTGAYGWKDYILQIPTALTVLFLYYSVNIFLGNGQKKEIYTLLYKTSCCVIALMMSCLYLLNIYDYIYREQSITTLTYKVEVGVYKNLYTTEQRANEVVTLEKELDRIVEEGEKVLFMDNVPFAYLMTEGTPFTPSTWDVMGYTLELGNYKFMYEYFETKEQFPDKIIYIDTGRNEVISIDEPTYKFNEFVNENYNMFYDNQKEFYHVEGYQLKSKTN